ncbi:CAP and S-layer homology domain-containing protein [Marinisporobacter balticus]|uniref:S-layer family protein n=1 Tax=Marinisporobacter balticus TaxID=2018667 RepID=A0A4R2KU59_9FIRM|nr:S-layer homology domain-containing protein [Marinisporobacter balticus]TCO76412.1 S-layer family protein [Marinisporobacter balticus]
MKNNFKYMLLIVLMLLASGIFLISYAEDGIGYFPPQPKDITVLVSKPNISIQLILNNNKVKEMEMKLNGNQVDAQYDPAIQTISYKPKNPLKQGNYKVDLSIHLEGWKPITQSWQFRVSENAVDTLPATTDAQKNALNYVNRYRKLLSLSEFKLDDALNASAMAHSNYMAINNKLNHDESTNNKGFTGISLYNRVGTFGYIGSNVAENISSGQKDYQEAIDGLVDAPYHRIAWINPFMIDLGYGVKNKYYTFDFGGNKDLKDQTILYPKENQNHVPISWDNNEIPNPLRFYGKSGKVGYPISFSYFSKNNIEKLTIEKATLKNSKGNMVEVYINTPEKDKKLQESILIIPKKPLGKGEKYTASIEGKILFKDKVAKVINKTWTFTTEVDEKDKNAWMKEFIYIDIEGHWAQKYILDLSEKGIISEKENDRYKPNDKITRAEFTEMIVKALGIKTKVHQVIFKDVNKKTDKALYIEAAYREGIIKGMGDGTFHPNRTIKREEIAALIIKGYEKKGDLNKIKQLPTLSFKDNDDISPWAVKYVKAAYELGIIKGRDTGAFSPKDFATRAEAAVIVKKLLEKI